MKTTVKKVLGVSVYYVGATALGIGEICCDVAKTLSKDVIKTAKEIVNNGKELYGELGEILEKYEKDEESE